MNTETSMTPGKVGECAAKHGFECLDHQNLPEIDGRAYILEHRASKAKLLYLRNDDDNKGFSITFKTPAADDTGVFHILEHSVLCGSRKFPVKEPFVNLLKSSMQTFLNAMTFPDKTMYPVASTNEKDLLNLMDVYMDAVFYPKIYDEPQIFRQEGWRYELEADEGDEGDGSVQLLYNGVVFNEMKGALSDPESVLYDTLSAALFPDTTYRFESGGVPAHIPDLSYEGFLDAHRRHYRPDNSYLVLYGNLDIDRFLAFLDESYLSPLAAQGWPEAQINPLSLQAPVSVHGVQREMATTPDNSCAALGFVIGEAHERERIIATSILLDALMGSNESPLKRALLDADIADDCNGMVADSMAQPFVLLEAQGLHEDAITKLRETVRTKVDELAAGSLDLALVEAALSHTEFVMREGNFGYPDGVIYSMSAMNGWLYDDRDALAYIRYEDLFADLKEKLKTDYFHRLLREVFLENPHEAQVEVVPVEADDLALERQRLDGIAAAMGPDELRAIAEKAQALKAAQEAPDDPEDLAKLPTLTIEDIGDPPHESGFHPLEIVGMEGLRHDVETHGIAYFYKYFDLGSVEFEELPYVALLALVLGKLDTASHSASEIDTLVQSKLGNLGFAVEVYEGEEGSGTFFPKFVVSASALADNVEYAATIVKEVVQTSDFYDRDKLYDLLVQRKVAMEQAFTMAGNRVATLRSISYFLPVGVLREKLSGIDFYSFLKKLIADFELRADGLSEKLAELAQRLFVDDECLLSFAGTDEDLRRYQEAGASLGLRLAAAPKVLEIPKPQDKREALIVPTDVTYTALSADRSALPGASSLFSGAWIVAARVLSLDHLWNEVRVIGGAYGVTFSSSRQGSTYFASFRDPNIDETVRRYEEAGSWLAKFDPSEEEFVGYVVSCAAIFDKPKKPRNLIRMQDSWHITGYSKDKYLGYRSQVIAVTLDEVRALGAAIRSLSEQGHLCTVGNKDVIEGSRLDFAVIDLFAE